MGAVIPFAQWGHSPSGARNLFALVGALERFPDRSLGMTVFIDKLI